MNLILVDPHSLMEDWCGVLRSPLRGRLFVLVSGVFGDSIPGRETGIRLGHTR